MHATDCQYNRQAQSAQGHILADDQSPSNREYDAYAALRYRDFRYLCSASVLTSFSHAVLSVIVGWELYNRTHSPLMLGLVGLVQIIPNLVLAIPAGHFVDQHNPKLVAVISIAAEAV